MPNPKKLSSDELCTALAVSRPDGNAYTGSTLMNKIIDTSIPPQEQPPEAGIREKNIQKTQNDAEAEMKEEQRSEQQVLP